MSQKFNPFPSVRRDRQRQLAREQDPDPTPHASPPSVRPPLPSRTSTEQTIRSSTVSSPLSPDRGGLYEPLHSNESTTFRSSGLNSTDDEAFDLYLAKQKELAAMRAQQSKSLRESVADREAREFEAIAEGSEGDADGLHTQNAEDEEGLDEEIELGHMQEIVPGLWIGDVVAARDAEALKEAGITAILTLLRQKLPPPPPGILTLPIPIDDTADADILCHLDGCVRWIADVLEAEQDADAQGKRGAVLVHCQAGMSRSATVVAAYLMKTSNISPEEAVEMIREQRPVVYPSETFREQLSLWHKANFKATVRNRNIRQWYMERTAAQVRNNGELEEEATEHMAKYPAMPTASAPATPQGGFGKRKIRCKMCRRNLATRDHMMDHILDQSPRPTPRSRAPSWSLAALNDQLPGSRQPSFSSGTRPTVGLGMSQINSSENAESEKAIPSPRRDESPGNVDPPPLKKAATDSVVARVEAAGRPGRKVLDPRALAASLPPQLAALRAGVRPVGSGNSSPTSPFPPDDFVRRSSSPASIASDPASTGTTEESALSTSPENNPVFAKPVSRRTSILAMTPNEPSARSRRDSAASVASVSRRGSMNSINGVSAANWPILVNPKCSGYFVEPLTWMEPMLASGTLAGKILCPNEKCGAKIGSFDWAGIQCGCKEWVVPGFCIHRSKVDEIW